MLLYARGWISERTGWENHFINLMMILAAVALMLALLLAAVRPEGFLTVGITIVGGAAFGVLIGFLGTLREYDEEKARQRRPQLQLETGRYTFWRTCRWRCRVMAVEFAGMGLFLGLLVALAGE